MHGGLGAWEKERVGAQVRGGVGEKEWDTEGWKRARKFTKVIFREGVELI